MKKNLFPLLILIAILCLTASCGERIDQNPPTNNAELADTSAVHQNDGVLDKGGADPTDNVSIIDTTLTMDVTDEYGHDDHGVVGELGQDASEALDDLTTPTTPSSETTQVLPGNGTR